MMKIKCETAFEAMATRHLYNDSEELAKRLIAIAEYLEAPEQSMIGEGYWLREAAINLSALYALNAELCRHLRQSLAGKKCEPM